MWVNYIPLDSILFLSYFSLLACNLLIWIASSFFRSAGDKFGTPSLWKTYTQKELLLIFPLISLIVGCVAYQLYLIYLFRLVVWYMVLYGIVFMALVVPTIIFRNTYYLHMHHYAIFGLLIPFFGFPNIFSLVWLGLVSGVFVEGISRWGMARCWYPGAQRQYG